MAATEELDEGTRTFNYGPHLEAPPSASVRIISGGAPWPPPLSPSMNQTFHYMLTLLSCAECVYTMGKWWGIGNLMSDGLPALVQKAGWRREREAGRALPAMPTASPGRRHHLSAAVAAWPLSPEVADSRQKRNRPQQMEQLYSGWPIRALCPCHMSLTLVFLFWQHFKTGPFSFGWRHKRERVKEKLTRPLSSLRLKFSKRAGTKRRTRLRANKSKAPPQKKSCRAPLQLPTAHSSLWNTLGPKEEIKRRVPTNRNVCKESACTKAICNFTKWQT